MNAKQAYYTMVGALVLIVGLGVASLVVGNKMLTGKTNKLVSLKLQSQVLSGQVLAFQQAKVDVKTYTPLNQIAETIVPQDKDQAQTVREIITFAQQTNIKIGSITFPDSNLGIKTSNPSQLTPVKGISGVYTLPITVQTDDTAPISFNQMIGFLQKLEDDRHTAQVTAVTITPDPDNLALLSFQLVVNSYIKP